MKKIILSSMLLLLFGAMESYAQIMDKAVYVNPKVGLNYTGFHETFEGVEIGNKMGFNAGLDIRIGQGLIFVQPGLHYFQVTNQYTYSTFGDDNVAVLNEDDVKIQSLKVPALLGVRLINTDIVHVRVNAGPSFNFPLNINDDEIEIGEGEFSDNFNDFNLGAIVGAGVDFSILSFDVGYEYGLSDYIELQSSEGQSKSSKNYQWIFSVGLLF